MNIFKKHLRIIGSVLSLLSISLFIKGILHVMSEYGVPSNVLQNAYYIDAITWVYTHMLVVGILILCIGYGIKEIKIQKWVSLTLFIIITLYCIMDFAHSDSVLGNSLYKGPQSIIPAIISLIISLSLLRLTFILFKNDKK